MSEALDIAKKALKEIDEKTANPFIKGIAARARSRIAEVEGDLLEELDEIEYEAGH